MGISYPEQRRYAPVYNRRSDSNHVNAFTANIPLTGTGATTTIWCHRIYPNIQGAITKYAMHSNSATNCSITAGTGSVKAAIYRVDEYGRPTTKLKNSDASRDIVTTSVPWNGFQTRVLTPSVNVELPNPLEPLVLCWVSNLNTVTFTTGVTVGAIMGSAPLSFGENFHPYDNVSPATDERDLEITVPTMTFSSFAFTDDFSTLGPTVFTGVNNGTSMANIDWFLAFAK
jgi:hypothetical protein